MKKYRADELQKILVDHKLYLEGDKKGSRAYLQDVDLRGADLKGADFRGAYLQESYLRGADLKGADLKGANLRGADLRSADLRGADLTGADLRNADLRNADLKKAMLPDFQIPQEGTLTVYKKLRGGVVAKLLIPEGAKRTSTLVGRKCRASEAFVLKFLCADKEVRDQVKSLHDHNFFYVVGQTVKTNGPEYDGDIRIECAPGIHFFLTREEAENYQ